MTAAPRPVVQHIRPPFAPLLARRLGALSRSIPG